MSSDNLVLCAASAYEEKFYLNEAFKGLPEGIKEDYFRIIYSRCGRRPYYGI